MKKTNRYKKNLDLTTKERKKNKLWNMKVTMISIVVDILETDTKAWKWNWGNRCSKGELGPQHYQNFLVYLEVYWRSKKTSSHWNSREGLPVKSGLKNSWGVKDVTIIKRAKEILSQQPVTASVILEQTEKKNKN